MAHATHAILLTVQHALNQHQPPASNVPHLIQLILMEHAHIQVCALYNALIVFLISIVSFAFLVGLLAQAQILNAFNAT